FRGHGKGERGDRDHQRDGTPFKGIDLTDDQLANLAELRESFKGTSKANRETLRSFKDAQRDLIRSSSFSQDSWNALVAQYKDDLVSAGVEKAKQRQAMFAVLTPEQQAELKAQREEGRKLRDLLRS
ncbi:MAG: Spy/CpxP family protein refolding chaperone, partial [Pseudomonadota bacterium]|nr:Spy/CpxP family protein refolding chaperone [Pseudomonadota bacterium]